MKQKRFTKLMSILLVMAMLFTMMPGMAFADNTVVLVSSASDLPTEIPAGTTYELTADITLSSGQQIETLAGVLDGKGYTITLADKPLADTVTGTIQNLGVLGDLQITSDYMGTMANKLNGGIIQCSYSMVSTSGG